MNHGFDDERGDYKPYVHDHLAYRYEIISILGKGSFGQVLKCYDYKLQTLRAVKIIRNKSRFHHQAKMELKILHHLVRKVRAQSSCHGTFAHALLWCPRCNYSQAGTHMHRAHHPCRTPMENAT